jgi:hypothetical protein
MCGLSGYKHHICAEEAADILRLRRQTAWGIQHVEISLASLNTM